MLSLLSLTIYKCGPTADFRTFPIMQAVYHLFSKNTHKEFSYGSMAAMLVIYFVMACWSAGTYISSGLVVPMLLIGGLYGRMVGVLFVDLFGIQGWRKRLSF